jgi:hypothetical protein
MPSGRAAALLVLATSALAVCGHPTEPDGALRPGAPRGVSNLDVPRDAFRAEFEAILATIDQSYGLKGAKGIDVGELRGRFGPDIDRAASPEAFYAVLVRLFAALHNSHSSLVLPASAFGFAGMTASLVGDRLLVAGAPADAALVDHGVARGWEVTAIDDVALADWMAGRSELVSASTTQYGRVAAAAQATRRFWFEPAARRYTLRSPSGDAATLEIRLDRPPAAAAAPPLASSRAIGEIGYVSVDALTGGVVAQFEGRAVEGDRQAGVDPRPASQHGRRLDPRPADHRPPHPAADARGVAEPAAPARVELALRRTGRRPRRPGDALGG